MWRSRSKGGPPRPLCDEPPRALLAALLGLLPALRALRGVVQSGRAVQEISLPRSGFFVMKMVLRGLLICICGVRLHFRTMAGQRNITALFTYMLSTLWTRESVTGAAPN